MPMGWNEDSYLRGLWLCFSISVVSVPSYSFYEVIKTWCKAQKFFNNLVGLWSPLGVWLMVITEGVCCMCLCVSLWAVIQLQARGLSGVWIKQSKASSSPAGDLTMHEAELGRRLLWLRTKTFSHFLQTKSHGISQGWFCKLITNSVLNPTGKED